MTRIRCLAVVAMLLVTHVTVAHSEQLADLRAKLEKLAEVDADARIAFVPADTTSARGSALCRGETVFVAYETGTGDIVTRQWVEQGWGKPEPVTGNAPRREGERWDRPNLVAGPDDNMWIAYRSQPRRRLFFHRWLGESWGPRIDGHGIFRVSPSSTGEFNEELRPIARYIVEGSRVRNAIEVRLISSDEPPVIRIESIPMVTMNAAPGEGTFFIDARDVSRTSGLTWQAEPPRKHPQNPLLSPSDDPHAPDTVRVFNRGSVRREGGRFRMWYSAVGTDSPISSGQAPRNWQHYMHVCYAESEDGTHWHRPELGLAEFKGSRRNNIVPVIQRLPTIYYDRHEIDPDRRYKCFGSAGPIEREDGHLLSSADGLRWRSQPSPRRYPGTRPYYAPEFHSVFRDERERNPAQRWKAYGLFSTGPFRRAAGMFTSPDGVHWTGYPENPIIDPLQGISPCIHDFLVWQEMGRYVGLLQVGDDLHNYEWELVVSRDGIHFARVSDGRPFLARGDTGQWDQGGIQAAVPVTVGDEYWFYYSGREEPWSSYPADPQQLWTVKMHCGLATIGAGRYAGFRLSEEARRGVLFTQPVRCDFDRELKLAVNATADAKNPVRVAILDAATRQPIEGYSLDACRVLETDDVSQRVEWSAHRNVHLKGERPVRIQFELRGQKSRLYGFAWKQIEES